MSGSSRPHGLQPIRFLHPWDFPGKNTRVSNHSLLQGDNFLNIKKLEHDLLIAYINISVIFGHKEIFELIKIIGEGNGNPLQCSCLENSRDGGAWWAAVYGVAQGWTQLKQLSSSEFWLIFPFL